MFRNADVELFYSLVRDQNRLMGNSWYLWLSYHACHGKKRNFTIIEKIGAVHLIKSYGGEGRKYLEILRIKYLVLPKYGTKY